MESHWVNRQYIIGKKPTVTLYAYINHPEQKQTSYYTVFWDEDLLSIPQSGGKNVCYFEVSLQEVIDVKDLEFTECQLIFNVDEGKGGLNPSRDKKLRHVPQ